MKTFFLSFSILLTTFFSFGQFQLNNVYSNTKNILGYTAAAREVQFLKRGEMVTYSLDQIEGYPHLCNKFSNGIITLQNDTIIKIPINYNAVTDAFELEKENTKFIITNNFSIKKIKIEGREFVYRVFTSRKGEQLDGYFEVIAEGPNCQLYKKFKKDFLEPVPSETHFNMAKSARFSEIDSLYFIGFDEDITYFKTNSKKNILGSFKNHKDKLSEFLRNRKFSSKNETDLISLVTFYNSL